MSAVVDSLLNQLAADVKTVAVGLNRVEIGEWTPNQLAPLPAACVVFESIDPAQEYDTPYRSFAAVTVSVVVFADKQVGVHAYTTLKGYHRDVLKALHSSTYLEHSGTCYHTEPGEFEHLDVEAAKITGFVQSARCLVSWQHDAPDSA